MWLPVLGSFLALTAPDLLANHSVALTEPLYLATAFAGFLCLGCYLQNQRRWWLLAAAILLALSTMTRYVGVTGIGAAVLALLFVEVNHAEESGSPFSVLAERMRRRLVTALIFGVAAVLPLICLSIRNRLATGGVSDRHFAFHPILMQTVVSGFSTVAQCLVLGKLRLDLRFAGFLIECVLLAALSFCVWQRGRTEKAANSISTATLPQVLLIYCLVYVAVLVLTGTFLIRHRPGWPQSSPVHVALLVLGPWAASMILRACQIRLAFAVRCWPLLSSSLVLTLCAPVG